MAKVTFTKYVRNECADGVVAEYAGDVDGVPFVGDANSVDGLSVSPASLLEVVKDARVKVLGPYSKGFNRGQVVSCDVSGV